MWWKLDYKINLLFYFLSLLLIIGLIAGCVALSNESKTKPSYIIAIRDTNILTPLEVPSQEAELQFEAAQFLEKQGYKKDALDTYYKIIRQYPLSQWRRKAEIKALRILFMEEDYQIALDLLLTAEPSHQLYEFRLGYCYYKLNHYEKAISYFQSALKNWKILSDYCYYYLAECYYKLEQYEIASKYYRYVLEQYPSSLYHLPCYIKLGKCYEKQGKYKIAKSYYLKLLNNEKLDEAELYLHIAICNKNLNLLNKAIKGYRNIIRIYPKSNFSILASNQLKTLLKKQNKKLNETDYYYIALVSFHNRQYNQSTKQFRQLLIKYPKSAFSMDAEYYIALSQYKLRNYTKAQGSFITFINKYSINEYTTRCYWYIASAASRTDKQEDARYYYNQLAKKYPKSRLSDDALWYIALSYYGEEDYQKAAKEYENTASKYPNREYAIRSLFRAGLCYYKLEEYAKAERAFNRIIKEHPNSTWVGNGLYWRGKCYLKLDKKDLAIKVFQRIKVNMDSYYYARAQTILDDLGLPTDDLFHNIFETPPITNLINYYTPLNNEEENNIINWLNNFSNITLKEAQKSLDNNTNYQCGLVLLQLGLVDLALSELKKVEDKYSWVEIAANLDRFYLKMF